MAADVKEMYHQFERTVFGEMSAPSRAYTMRRNADENGEDLPLGVKQSTSAFTWMMAYHQRILVRKQLKCGSR